MFDIDELKPEELQWRTNSKIQKGTWEMEGGFFSLTGDSIAFRKYTDG